MVPTNTSLAEKMLPIYTISIKTTTRQITTSPVAGMVPFFMSERFWNKRKLRNPSENIISSLSYIFARIQIVKTLYPRFTPTVINASDRSRCCDNTCLISNDTLTIGIMA